MKTKRPRIPKGLVCSTSWSESTQKAFRQQACKPEMDKQAPYQTPYVKVWGHEKVILRKDIKFYESIESKVYWK